LVEELRGREGDVVGQHEGGNADAVGAGDGLCTERPEDDVEGDAVIAGVSVVAVGVPVGAAEVHFYVAALKVSAAFTEGEHGAREVGAAARRPTPAVDYGDGLSGTVPHGTAQRGLLVPDGGQVGLGDLFVWFSCRDRRRDTHGDMITRWEC
jgi:hypothetical protein